MCTRAILKGTCAVALGLLLVVSLSVNLGLVFGRYNTDSDGRTPRRTLVPSDTVKKGDEQLASLLVKLELKTRGVLAGHFTRSQSAVPGVNVLYQRLLVKNLILPAAVADSIFSETVPAATGGRAWVKMIVDEPRNPNNKGDEVSASLLAELRQGELLFAERNTETAYYYAEPIVAKEACLYCHGAPRGAPDPFFAKYQKEGWRAGETIGAVVARVSPEGTSGAVADDDSVSG